MGHYLRVLSPSDACVPASALREALAKAVPGFVLEGDAGREEWSDLLVRRESTPEAEARLLLERNTLNDEDELVSEEVEEFLQELEEARPKSAARWVSDYLRRVRTVYAVQVLEDEKEDWAAADALMAALREHARGIIQADDEGFSNEEGDAILFSSWEGAEGTWRVAVLDKGGAWQRFEMELGNRAHQEAFLRGEVPKGTRTR